MIDTEALRKKVIDLAIRGKLTEQLPEDGTAEELYAQIQEEKARFIKEGKIKKEKPLPAIEEDEIPFEIPKNWKWVRLSEISDTNIGLTYHPENVIEHGTVVLRSNNIQNGKFDFSDLVEVNCTIRDNQYLKTNDILICSRNGSKRLVGKCAIYNGELGDVSFGAFMAILRTPLYKYIYYYLKTEAFRRYYSNDDSKQINQVTQDILKKAIVPLPPLAEQKRIADKIDSVLSEIDIIDSLQSQYYNNLESLKSKIIDAGIRGKLTEPLTTDRTAEELYEEIQKERQVKIRAGVVKREKIISPLLPSEIPFDIPYGWRWCRLGELFNFIDYRGATPNKLTSGVPFVTAKNVRQGYIDYSIREYISEDDYNNRQSRGISHKGDLLFTTEAPMGFAAIADLERFSAGQRLITLQQYTEEPALENKYYMYVISTQFFQKQLDEKSSGTTVKGIKADRLKTLLVPLPPLQSKKGLPIRLMRFCRSYNEH